MLSSIHKPVAVERDKSGGRDLVDLQCEVSVWPKEADSEHLCYTCVPPLCLPASPARGGAGGPAPPLGSWAEVGVGLRVGLHGRLPPLKRGCGGG